jgi:hypothetical protein
MHLLVYLPYFPETLSKNAFCLIKNSLTTRRLKKKTGCDRQTGTFGVKWMELKLRM